MLKLLLVSSILIRVGFFLWGLYQDATMVPRYTDVDYLVFTDAAAFVAEGFSPYARDTYRYTPLLSWLVLPTAIESFGMFNFGKLLFMAGDIVAGVLIIKVLRTQGVPERQACLYSTLWLLNPMVCAISSRGSSEGLLGAIIMLMLWLAVTKRYFLVGLAAGFAVHFKIYPFIYIPTILWNMGPPVLNPFVRSRMTFLFGTVLSFSALTAVMYYVYGYEYLEHSWIHHLVRLDHRHNFSVYSTVLYYASASKDASRFAFEHWAFVPQLLLSAVLIPLLYARINLAQTMAVQTIVFVAYNKVCTSQYFLWYMVLLPFFIPQILKSKLVWISGFFWVVFQGMWLYYGFQLEFLGQAVYTQLFASTILFFCATNLLAIALVRLIR